MTLRLFRVAGIQVYLHFSWFVVAAIEMSGYSSRYHAPFWGVIEYLSLFGIVLMHEFGHALACRQVGGSADRIVLWPLGGVAFVSPPPRPGAYLWSIAAGPLVNLVLLPLLTVPWLLSGSTDWDVSRPDLYNFINAIWSINIGLLIFNLLPVYPLDGGQIVRALLWFKLGPIRSLKIASVIGLIGAVGFGIIAWQWGSFWLGILAFFVFSQAQVGWRSARNLAHIAETESRPPPPVSPPPV
jgi:Zn-dependent protease